MSSGIGSRASWWLRFIHRISAISLASAKLFQPGFCLRGK